jgi:HAD superfamily hydrolase (TIGR01549 family)
MMQNIGLTDIALYTIFSFQNPYKLKDKVFDILNSCKYKAYPHIVYSDGRKVPDIMCYWMAGGISSQNILSILNNRLNELQNSNKIRNKRELKILKSLFNNMFNPRVLASCMKPIKGAARLLKMCKDKGNILVILSNFDSESFRFLKNSLKNRSIFKYFNNNHIFISGDIKMLKPSSDIFNYVLNKLNVSADRCIFIDDQIENIKGALKCGIESILIENHNLKSIEHYLKNADII